MEHVPHIFLYRFVIKSSKEFERKALSLNIHLRDAGSRLEARV